MADCSIPFVAYQIDVARRLEKPETLDEIVDALGDSGYHACVLYLEDAFAYPRHPGIGRAHAYTVEQMKALQARCARHGQELIPVIPALGHAAYITAKEGYARFDEGFGADALTGTLSPSLDETYELLEELFADWCDAIPGSYLHVGLDESPAMGRLAEREGRDVDHAKMFADHCNRLHGIVSKLGRRMIIWGDMFYYFPEAIELVNREIIVADWYYYPFEDTPRVEAFNFAPVDLTGVLKEAGFTVWGTPSVWPNMPFANIEERWRNVGDWCRYGEARQIDGLLITDWENSTGFASNTTLLLHAFGKAVQRRCGVADQLSETLQTLTGLEAAGALADDLLELGQHQLTGRDDRILYSSPLEAWIIPERSDYCHAHWEACRELLGNLLDLEGKTADPAGKRLLQALRLTHRIIVISWRLGAVLPDYMERLRHVAHGQIDRKLYQHFRELADELEALAGEYAMLWHQVRFADDTAPVVEWAEGAATKLLGWAELLEETSPAPQHPLFAQARLLCHLRCRHPALPVIRMTATWDDGTRQTASGAMIRFAGDYATPDKEWDEFRCFVLDRDAVPEFIDVVVDNYGQVGIVDLAVEHGDNRFTYVPRDIAGDHVVQDDEALWLGPKGAAPGDPTTRQHHETARFYPEPDGA